MGESTSIFYTMARRITSWTAIGSVALISGIIFSGWAITSPRLIVIMPGMVPPMHPITALLFELGVLSLVLSKGRPSRAKRHWGFGLAAAVCLAGTVRLCGHILDIGSGIDHLLFPHSIVEISEVFAPIRIRIAPSTSLNFILIGAALSLLHLPQRKYRLLAFTLALMSALLGVFTLSRYLFLDVASLGSPIPVFPMSISTAASFVLLSLALSLELANPSVDFAFGADGHVITNAMQQSLGSKVGVGFGAAVFMLCGVGIFSYQSMAQFVIDSHWTNHTYQVLAAINGLYANIKDAEGAGRGYVITGKERFLGARQAAVDAILPSLHSLEALTAENPAQQQRIHLLNSLLQQKIDFMQSLVGLRQTQGFEKAQLFLTTGPGTSLMNEIHRLIDEMRMAENILLLKREAETETNARRGITFITLGSAVALAMVIASGWMLTRDISGRARTEDALRASETKFRGLLQSAPDGMVIVNDRGLIELVNTQAEQLFGYTADQLVGQRIELIIPAWHCEGPVGKCDGNFSSPVAQGMGAGRELFGLRKDGTEFPVEISLSPLRTSDGLHVSSAIRDVTRCRQEEVALSYLNAALRDSNAQLGAMNKELESFSYSVSHDLRAPLRSIDGFSQVILEDYSEKLDAEGQDHLRRIRAASQRMGQLIDDLLNLSHVTRSEIKRETVDLSKIAREVANELRTTAPERNAEFVVADGLVAETDARLMRIVLTNLLGNAWKFTSKREHARIEFGSSGENGKREFFTRDNGAGFDSAYAGKLFGAFQRLHSPAEFPGTGIGLATVQRIVQRQGGRVWAEGKPGEGASFHFTL